MGGLAVTRMHGKEIRLYLNERDVSSDVMEVSVTPQVATHDVTTFGSSGWDQFDAGRRGYEASLNAFYQPQAGGIGQQLETLGSTCILTIVGGNADAAGDWALLTGPGLLSGVSTPMSIADMVKQTASIKGSDSVSLNGDLLHVLGSDSSSGSGTSVDAGAAVIGYGRANLHVTSCSGTFTVSVWHSPDDTNWLQAGTFAAVSSSGAQSIRLQAAYEGGLTYESALLYNDDRFRLDRYRRSKMDVGSTGNVTYVAAVAGA